MRRPVAALSVAALLTGLLAACSGGSDTPSPSPSSSAASSSAPSPSGSSSSAPAQPSAADLASLAKATIGGTDTAPEISYEWPFLVDAPAASVVREGTGEVVKASDSVNVNYTIYSGAEGTKIMSTWEQGHTETIPLTGLNPQFDQLVASIVGHKVGTRVLYGTPSNLADEANPAPPMLWLIEVVSILPKRASGTPVTPPAGLPTVTLASDGKPSVDIPKDYKAPSTLVAQTLIKGDGPAIAKDDYITVAYSGWLFDGTQFDSSWKDGGSPFYTQIGAGQVIDGWDQGLVGQTVGSQVLLVIPSDLAYGKSGSGQIPADAPLVFVVDILAKN